jgi:adenylate cyclase class 2
MLEVEMKFRAPENVALEDRLREWGAVADKEREEADAYFNAPHRDFAQTDEALRIRQIGAANYVTYKGPRRDATTKTRAEIEVGLENGDGPAEDFQRILLALGFRPVAVVRKRRRVWKVTRGGYKLEICLDDVERVGRYIELEIQAPEAELDAARGAVQQAATELGLTQSERRSYLELLLAKG